MFKSGSASRNSGKGYFNEDLPTNPPPIPRNRFQKSGNDAVYEVKETENACVMRVDVAGSPESSLVHSVDKTCVHFHAEEPAMPEYDHAGRVYEGTMVLDPIYFDLKKARVELLNGVLWITVPKISRLEAKKYQVVQRVMKVKITEDDVA